MGTRSHTVVKQGEDVLLVMYRQFDGYLDGHGKVLAEYMEEFTFVNGFNSQDKNPDIKVANGAGCFAAQLVMTFKSHVANRRSYDHDTEEWVESKGNTIGGIYLAPLSDADYRHDYTYEIVFPDTGLEPTITIYEGDHLLTEQLALNEFKDFCVTYKAEEEEEE